MKKLLMIFLFLGIYTDSLVAGSAVTYTFSGGRFGDDLVAYCHAKWIAFMYDIPLLYRPFPHSDQLMMHERDALLTQEVSNSFEAILDISKVDSYSIEPDKNILYVIPYFPESVIEQERPWFFFKFYVDWSNPGFKKALQQTIAPRFLIQLPEIPKNCISVALHVRIGTGFDIASLKDFNFFLGEPQSQLKFPVLKYYSRELKRLAQYYPNQKLYVHLFTDHNDPKELIDIFEKELGDPEVTFAYRAINNRHDLNILEDFFALTLFDCLIRPDANFSLVASKLGNYKIQISPWHSIYHDNSYVIDEICLNGIVCKV